MGKTVVTSRDYPGFIVNRILIPMLNEAAYALMEGLGTAEDIDTACEAIPRALASIAPASDDSSHGQATAVVIGVSPWQRSST